MRQLLLDWGTPRPPTLDSYVVGRNQELAALLHRIAANVGESSDRLLLLWGEAGAGKSHLLRALSADPREIGQVIDVADEVLAPGTKAGLADLYAVAQSFQTFPSDS